MDLAYMLNTVGKYWVGNKMKAEYERAPNAKYLVLRIRLSGLKKRISADDVGKWACDHDYLISDCGHCWDCGIKKPLRHPPTNWALPKMPTNPRLFCSDKSAGLDLL